MGNVWNRFAWTKASFVKKVWGGKTTAANSGIYGNGVMSWRR
jgi:hypothetical protein